MSPLGVFVYDNLFHPTAGSVLDSWGILFGIGGMGGTIRANFNGQGFAFYTSPCAGCFAIQVTSVNFTIIPPQSLGLLSTQTDEPISEPGIVIGFGACLLILLGCAVAGSRGYPHDPALTNNQVV